MRQKILRRLEALEKEHRSREQREQSSLLDARVYIWKIVLAYHLGDLTPIRTVSRTVLPDGQIVFIVYRRDDASSAPERVTVRVIAKIMRAP